MEDMLFLLISEIWRWRVVLCQDVVVLNGPLGVTAGVFDLRIAQAGIAHTQNAKLGAHAIEVQADTIEIRVGGAMGEG